ncbi:response regulator transcription factor [Hyphomicrobium sp.]|uniref:response regulator transcription factor n=1 Tax=Hyphomicrobium sp. TaxID=82 RepID=UPI000FC2ECA8|nr:response regulator transcription factor [Hyphomicrobium sp.]RUP09960.1 MAG: response regulator transcription factor [Hyphomicrobium sp.]
MHLLIVDDHPIVSSGVRLVLCEDNDIVVRDARSIAEAKAAIEHQPPDVMLLDNEMHDGSGLDFCRATLAKNPTIGIIVFSVTESPTVALDALQRGAKGFISKTNEVTDLRRALRTVASGEVWLSEPFAQRIAFLKTTRLSQFRLSSREQQVVRNLAKGRNFKQIAKTMCISYWTVVKDCQGLRQKLDARNSTELVRIASELNLI